VIKDNIKLLEQFNKSTRGYCPKSFRSMPNVGRLRQSA
jgi:hypothetical protein